MTPSNGNPAGMVQRQVDAYNAHQLANYAATYADEAAYIRIPSVEITIAGRTAIREAFGGLFANQPLVHIDIKERMTLGRFVIDHEEITGRTDVPSAHAFAIYEVAGGLIQRVWVTRE